MDFNIIPLIESSNKYLYFYYEMQVIYAKFFDADCCLGRLFVMETSQPISHLKITLIETTHFFLTKIKQNLQQMAKNCETWYTRQATCKLRNKMDLDTHTLYIPLHISFAKTRRLCLVSKPKWGFNDLLFSAHLV